MATLTEIGNLVNCGVGVDLGTGGKGCEPRLKATTSLWFTKKGFKFDQTLVFDEDYIKQLQAERKLIVLKGITEFTTNLEENVKETLPNGEIDVARRGLYAFNAMFNKGFAYQAALTSLNSFGAYDTLFVDADGNILGTIASDGSLKGISTGMVDADGIQFATFSTSMKQGLSFQFLDRIELDTDYYFVSNKEIDFRPQTIDGVNEVLLTVTPIANLATEIIVKAKLKQGRSSFIGVPLANFLIQVGGVTVTPSALAEVDGTYTFTVTALNTNDVVTVALYDTANVREGIILDTDVYKSATTTVVVG